MIHFEQATWIRWKLIKTIPHFSALKVFLSLTWGRVRQDFLLLLDGVQKAHKYISSSCDPINLAASPAPLCQQSDPSKQPQVKFATVR